MEKKNLVKRILMSLFGVIICAISVGIFKIAALGVDPFQSFMAGLDALVPIKFGTLYVIANAVLFIFMFLFDRHYIGIATFINLFLLSGGAARDIITIAGAGTIITAFFMGPLIEFFNVHCARPILNK